VYFFVFISLCVFSVIWALLPEINVMMMIHSTNSAKHTADHSLHGVLSLCAINDSVYILQHCVLRRIMLGPIYKAGPIIQWRH